MIKNFESLGGAKRFKVFFFYKKDRENKKLWQNVVDLEKI